MAYDDFFARLNWYAAQKLMHLEALSEETRETRDRVMQGRMAALTLSYGKSVDDAGKRMHLHDDVLLPARFLPTPVGLECVSSPPTCLHTQVFLMI